MVLVKTKDMLNEARNGRYGVGMFITFDLSFIMPIIQAAEEECSPIMIGATPGIAESVAGESYYKVLKVIAEKAKVPVCVHLDHGKTLEQIMMCVRNGWTSVMFDAADRPLKDNIRLTRQIAKLCHAAKIEIEGELGQMPVVKDQNNIEFPKEMMTKPEEAEAFVKETGVDILAVSVGQIHHFPVMENGVHPIRRVAKLDLERLKKIRDVVGDTFICTHAGSHVPFESLKKAVSIGVVKVNIGTALSSMWTDTLRKAVIENPDEVFAHKVLVPAGKAIKEEVASYIRVLGSNGKA
ncbi:MAG: class II fructose-bisphosphate aldolase [Nitrososphaeria archaeon]